jgi:hypothetical protein
MLNSFVHAVLGKRSSIRRERRRAKVLEQTIDTFRSNYESANRHGLADFRVVYNTALYLLLFDRDFSVLKLQMFEADGVWARRFVARQMAVTFAEACEDLSALLGKEFREAVERLEAPADDMAKLSAASKTFHDARRTHETRLRELRNSIGAHRELNTAIHLDAVERLDFLEVYRMGPPFYVAFEQLVDAMTALVAHMGQPAVILKHLARKASAV